MQKTNFNLDGNVTMWPKAGQRMLAWIALSIVVLLVFRTTDQIDVFFSDAFFTQSDCSEAVDGVRCGDFAWQHVQLLATLRAIGHDVPLYLMAVVCLHMTWLMMFNPNKTLADIYPPLVAIIVGLVGPLLTVNLLLKENWGRPRPMQTLFFGGDHPYVVPGDISTFCESNCSFVSGEAAAAFWMLALMFYFTGRNRTRFVVGATILASAISFLRVIFGRHYISDIVVAALISISLIAISVWLLQTPIVRRMLLAMLKFSNTYAFGRHKMKNRRKLGQ